MRGAIASSFVTLGVTSLVGQVLLIRELVMAFYGNEFFLGWVLFAWVGWVALGVGWEQRRRGAVPAAGRLGMYHGWEALLLPLEMAVIRLGRPLSAPAAGAVPNLAPAVGLALLALAPLCLLLGRHFVAGVRLWGQENRAADVPGRTQGRAYAAETAGFVAGGLVYSFWLAPASEFRVAGMLAMLNSFVAFQLAGAWTVRGGGPRWPAISGIIAGAILMLAGPRLDRVTLAWRHPGQRLVETQNSIHGQWTVTALDSQINYFANGLLMGAQEEQWAAESFVHLPMLWHPQPRHVLLLGGGFTGAIGEILRHDPARVDYVELDRVLMDLVFCHAGPAQQRTLADPRVKIHFGDARHFFRMREPEMAGHDVILINLPGPGTIFLNRFYSREFFREARCHLAPGGILAVRLPFSPDYLGPELEELGASLWKTLREEFPAVAILPEYEILYLAGRGAPPDTAEVLERYRARGLQNEFLIPAAIEMRMTDGRVGQVAAAFWANRTAKINRDDRPIACLYLLAYWLREFYPAAAGVMLRISRGGLGTALGWATAGLALLLLGVRRQPRRMGLWGMGVASFSLMAAEIVLLMAYQVVRGYLYYRLALILAALMLGMTLGAAAGTRRLAHANIFTLAVLHLLLAAYSVLLAGVTNAAARLAVPPEGPFLLLAGLIGALTGYEFPTANRVYLAGLPCGGEARGTIYAADLIGSGLGAVGFSLWALPILGSARALGVLAALNVATAAVAAFISKRRE